MTSLEGTLRQLIREEVRQVVRDEIGALLRSRNESPAADNDNQPVAYMTVGDAATHAAVSERTIRRWIETGRLTGFRAGRVLRVCPRELKNVLAPAPSKNATRAQIRERARAILESHQRCA